MFIEYENYRETCEALGKKPMDAISYYHDEMVRERHRADAAVKAQERSFGWSVVFGVVAFLSLYVYYITANDETIWRVRRDQCITTQTYWLCADERTLERFK